ncbi:hypothetical protein Tco_0917836, partial [Tanacetum coccineum]
TLQVLPSFEEYTPSVTCPKEVEETLGTPVELEPLDKTQLEDLGLNTCNHGIPISNREVPSFDEPEPQPNPLLNCLSLDVSQGEEPPIKPHSPDSFRMKEVDSLTINTPPSPHVASSHLKNTASLGVDTLNWEMFDDDWGLESKEVSPLGKELSLFDRLNEVERGRMLEAHHLEPILQQQISQRMALSHHDVRLVDCGWRVWSESWVMTSDSLVATLGGVLWLIPSKVSKVGSWEREENDRAKRLDRFELKLINVITRSFYLENEGGYVLNLVSL